MMADDFKMKKCMYCGETKFMYLHREKPLQKGIHYYDDIYCHSCKALLWGRAYFVKKKLIDYFKETTKK